MRYLLVLFGLISTAYGQFAPTSAKTAFKNGISIGTRDSTAYTANDSLVVVINRQGRMMYRSTDGYWKLLANAASSDYVPYTGAVDNVALGNFRLTARSLKTDSIYANSSAGMYLTTNTGTAVAHWGGGGSVEVDFKGFAGYDANRSASYTTRSFTDKGYVDSADALRLLISDTAAMLLPYLRKSDTATMLSNYRRKTTLIENADLRNSAITINGSSTALGGSISVGTVTSVAASAGTGISVSGSPITGSGTLTITNTAPDQTVTLTAGTGISVSGTYPNFTVTNTSPSSGGTVTSVTASAPLSSSGGTTPNITISQATTSTNGFLSSTDWNTFNNKQAQLNGTGFVRFSGTTPSYITGTSSQFVKADGTLDGTSYATAASISGTTNFIPLFTSAGSIGNSTIFQNGSDGIFINGQASTSKLKLVNPLTSSLFQSGVEFIRTTVAAGAKIESLRDAGTGGVGLSIYTTADNTAETAGTYTERVRISNNGIATFYGALNGTSLSMSGGGSFLGNVGIGTASPSSRAHVSFTGDLDGLRLENSFRGHNYLLTTAGSSAEFFSLYDVDNSQYLYQASNSGGQFFLVGGATKLAITSGGAVLTNGATDDGTNKLIVNGGVKGIGNIRVANEDSYLSVDDASNLRMGFTKKTGALPKLTFGSATTFAIAASSGAGIEASNTFTDVFTLTTSGVGNISGTFKASGSGGWTIGDVAGENRIQYTSSAFNLYNSGNAFASLNAGAATFSSSVTASSFIRSGGTSTQSLQADGSVTTLTSGTYTPTLTNGSNVSSSSASTCYWTRVGDIVTVSGWVSITHTTNENSTVLGISLPVSSNLTAFSELSGSGNNYISTSGGQVGKIEGDATNDRATLTFYPFFGSGSATQTQFTFTYRVL